MDSRNPEMAFLEKELEKKDAEIKKLRAERYSLRRDCRKWESDWLDSQDIIQDLKAQVRTFKRDLQTLTEENRMLQNVNSTPAQRDLNEEPVNNTGRYSHNWDVYKHNYDYIDEGVGDWMDEGPPDYEITPDDDPYHEWKKYSDLSLRIGAERAEEILGLVRVTDQTQNLCNIEKSNKDFYDALERMFPKMQFSRPQFPKPKISIPSSEEEVINNDQAEVENVVPTQPEPELIVISSDEEEVMDQEEVEDDVPVQQEQELIVLPSDQEKVMEQEEVEDVVLIQLETEITVLSSHETDDEEEENMDQEKAIVETIVENHLQTQSEPKVIDISSDVIIEDEEEESVLSAQENKSFQESIRVPAKRARLSEPDPETMPIPEEPRGKLIEESFPTEEEICRLGRNSEKKPEVIKLFRHPVKRTFSIDEDNKLVNLIFNEIQVDSLESTWVRRSVSYWERISEKLAKHTNFRRGYAGLMDHFRFDILPLLHLRRELNDFRHRCIAVDLYALFMEPAMRERHIYLYDSHKRLIQVNGQCYSTYSPSHTCNLCRNYNIIRLTNFVQQRKY